MLVIYIIMITAAVSFAATVVENQIKKQPTKGYNLSYIITAVVGSLVGGFVSMGDSPWLMRLGPLSSPIVWAVLGAVVLTGILLAIRLSRSKTETEPPTDNKAE